MRLPQRKSIPGLRVCPLRRDAAIRDARTVTGQTAADSGNDQHALPSVLQVILTGDTTN